MDAQGINSVPIVEEEEPQTVDETWPQEVTRGQMRSRPKFNYDQGRWPII